MNTYSWNAKNYEKNSQAQQKWAKALSENLNLTGTEDILDLGCGNGKVTAESAAMPFRHCARWPERNTI